MGGGCQELFPQSRIAGDLHQANFAHISHRVANGRSIHVVLHRAAGHHHVANAHARFPGAGHPQVQYPPGMMPQNHALRAQRRVDLARTAHRQHNLLSKERTGIQHIHADFFLTQVLHLRLKLFQFHGHGANQADHRFFHPSLFASAKKGGAGTPLCWACVFHASPICISPVASAVSSAGNAAARESVHPGQ